MAIQKPSAESSFEREMSQDISSVLDTILIGDALTIAKELPSNRIDCIISSPPYFGHRQYSTCPDHSALEIGREDEPRDYIKAIVAVFNELYRVLNPNGTLWLNIGDTYRDEQLLGIPWRVALELQDSGWIMRNEIIWHKPNAMPSSVKNRLTIDHEHVFLFCKSKDYYYNADAIREPHVTFSPDSRMKGGRNHFGKADGTPEAGKNQGNANLHRGRWDQAFHPLGRNKRTVWSIPLGKFRDVHFAVFPESLVEVCLLAGTTDNQIVLDPFMGAGTTAVVAKKLGRHFLGIELVPFYAEMAKARIEKTQPPLFISGG